MVTEGKQLCKDNAELDAVMSEPNLLLFALIMTSTL